MNRTTKFLAPALLAISTYCLKVHLQKTLHRCFNTGVRSSLLLPKTCPLLNIMEGSAQCPLEAEEPDLSEQINNAMKNVQLENNLIDTLDMNLNANSGDFSKHPTFDKSRYKEIRKWQKINDDKWNNTKRPEDVFDLRVLSFNILAQDLLETYPYLYINHDRKTLAWEKRKPLIIEEILESQAHIVCLQEMQKEHLDEFLTKFHEQGYGHIYKKRTNDKTDGLLLLYKQNVLSLLEFSKVELYQTGTELLSRDNVGLVAKFSLKDSPESKIVIATTHLLYNPRRNDVRLGQVQILLAEIERMAFFKNTPLGPEYLPVILCGDFNLEPYSGVYKFIVEGSIEFNGKGRNLEPNEYRSLTNSLIPPYLHVTDECQHFNVLAHRLSGKPGGEVMLRNAEYGKNLDNYAKSSPSEEISNTKPAFNSRTTEYQKIEIADGHFVTFSSGLLTHPFMFQSAYRHRNNKGLEATTYQEKWITVDYIFHSSISPIEIYTLPTTDECSTYLPTIPNSVVGSDHLCLGTTFRMLKKS